MKKRKHGFQAQTVQNIVEAAINSSRLTTLVTFESDSRSYLWTTDRGRSRLIKH